MEFVLSYLTIRIYAIGEGRGQRFRNWIALNDDSCAEDVLEPVEKKVSGVICREPALWVLRTNDS